MERAICGVPSPALGALASVPSRLARSLNRSRSFARRQLVFSAVAAITVRVAKRGWRYPIFSLWLVHDLGTRVSQDQTRYTRIYRATVRRAHRSPGSLLEPRSLRRGRQAGRRQEEIRRGTVRSRTPLAISLSLFLSLHHCLPVALSFPLLIADATNCRKFVFLEPGSLISRGCLGLTIARRD